MNREVFLHELVVGFGFLGGLWINIGIDPEAELIRALWDVVESISPQLSHLRAPCFIGLALFTSVAAILGAYNFGKWVGIVAVVLAFIGGLFITSFGIFFFVAALVVGLIAPSIANDRPKW